VPALADVDVAVLGGGPAGSAAAVAAARAGVRTLLVERYGFLGGTATAALVNIFHPLFDMAGGHQVIGGVCHEFLRRLLDMGAARMSGPGNRANWFVETEYAKVVLDRMVEESGARVLLHGLFAGCDGGPDRVSAVFIETRGGPAAVTAPVFIDCTGDADLVAAAGLPFDLEVGRLQSPSLCMRLAGVDKGAFDAWGKDIERDMDGITAILRRRGTEKGWGYPNYLWGNFSDRRPGEVMFSAIRIPNVNAVDPWDLTRAEIEARRQALWMAEVLREEVPGFRNATIMDLGAQIGIRETRRIRGAYVLTGQELLDGRRFEDGIAQGTYPIDVHAARGGGIVFMRLDGRRIEIDADCRVTTGFWTPAGQARSTPFWQTPYRCLHFRECANVLVAGRPISVDASAYGATRVMVNCMQFGHAAGVAAALAVQRWNGDVRAVDPVVLRQALAGQDAVVL
jgi:glycine/D-amino acid oxidase-like deaminating enzyme